MHGIGKVTLPLQAEVNLFIIQSEKMVGAKTELGYSFYA